MSETYQQNGYCVFKGFLKDNELLELREVLLEFHESWKRKNSEFYASNAINSAYITGTEHLNTTQRKQIFNFVGSSKLMDVATSLMNRRPTFMNTQLFFDPFNKEQNNYWHRDLQYHLTAEEQEAALSETEVLHFRVPMFDEPGVELVPGSHQRWDTNEELNVRLEKNGKKKHNNLSTGLSVELNAGDLLVFSANMIHRGLYGLDRLSLDILFCDPDPSLLQWVSDDCLPNKKIMASLENADAFKSTIELLPSIKKVSLD